MIVAHDSFLSRRILNTLTYCSLIGTFLVLPVNLASGNQETSSQRSLVASPASEKAKGDFGKVPLSFEVNRGQVDRRVKFLARGAGYNLFLSPTEATLTLRRSSKNAAAPTSRFRMQLVGMNAEPKMSGLENLPGKVSYFVGNDPKQWRADIPTYGRLEYREVYPGIDMVYYGAQGLLEYDFVVAPGADPSEIVLSFPGAEKLEIDNEGDLLIHVAGGDLRQHKPYIYQEVGGVRHEIDGEYVFRALSQQDSSQDAQGIGFRIAAYDPSKPLIIDPVLSYSTYLGGTGFDEGRGIAVDSSGNAYVTGTTAPMNDIDLTEADIFTIKLDPSGSRILYAAFFGSSGKDESRSVAVDADGNAYVTGTTQGSDFPTTTGAFQESCGSGWGAFVAKLNQAGTALVYSTYLCGGSNPTSAGLAEGNGIAVDAVGNAYVTGYTTSLSFPTTAGAYKTACAGADVFVTKVNSLGSALLYSTCLGGVGIDQGRGIAIDTSGNAYVTGFTMAPTTVTDNDFPVTSGAFQTICKRVCNVGFVTKFNATGSSLDYSTLLGGTDGFTEALGIAVDVAGNAYVTGQTKASDFPTINALQRADEFITTFASVFVTKVAPDGKGLVYSTFLGRGEGWGIAADAAGNAYVTGSTGSPDFPLVNPWQPYLAGNDDVFVTKINPTGSAIIYSTFLGGFTNDEGRSISIDGNGSAYITGFATSSDFPVLRPAQPLHGAGNPHFDAFVAKLTETTASADLVLTHIGPPPQYTAGIPQTYRFLVSNLGPDDAEDVILTDGTGIITGTQGSGVASQGTCTAIGGRVACELGTIRHGATATMTLVVNGGSIYTVANVNSAKADDPNRSNNTILVSGQAADSIPPAPQLTGLTPSTVVAGTGPVTVRVSGSGFTAASVVQVNWIPRATTYSSPSELSIQLSAEEVISAETTYGVTVQTPAVGGLGGGTSVAQTVRVVAPQPVPELTSVTPTTVGVGTSGAVLTVTGTNFIGSTVGQVNGSTRSTVVSSATQLSVTLTAADAANVGPLTLRLFTPAPGGGTSNAATVTVQSGIFPTLTVNGGAGPITVGSGATVTVALQNGSGNAGDWIGVYLTGTADSAYLNWFYLDGTKIQPSTGRTSATLMPALPSAPGTYEFRLFPTGNGIFTRLATSPPVMGVSLTLSVNGGSAPITVLSGATVTVGVQNSSGNAGDWIGVYRTGSADSAYLNWFYLDGTKIQPITGRTSATLMSTLPSGPGTYEFRLFPTGNGIFTRLATSPTVTLQSAASPILTVNGTAGPITVGSGATVTVGLQNGSGNAGDWIGLYLTGTADSAYLNWFYLDGTKIQPSTGRTSTTLMSTLPSGAGSYEFRLFPTGNGIFTRLATSPTATVQSVGSPIVTINGSSAPITVAPGSTVTVVATNLVANDSNIIALFATGTDNGQSLDWVYLTGNQATRSGALTGVTTTFVLPSVGTFEVRVLHFVVLAGVSAGYVTDATSPTVTVQGSGASPTLTVNGSTTPIMVSSGATVSVGLQNGSGNAGDWIGVYLTGTADSAYLNWFYLDGTKIQPSTGRTSTTLTSTHPSASGTYEFRLFPTGNGIFTRLTTSPTVTVQ